MTSKIIDKAGCRVYGDLPQDTKSGDDMPLEPRPPTRAKRRVNSLQPVFVERRPKRFEPGKLYIVGEGSWSGHLCACGCGAEIDVGFSPGYRYMVWDGPTVTIRESIGNNHLPCKSHYYITRNKVEWLTPCQPTGRVSTG